MAVDFDTETYVYDAPSAASVPDEEIDAPKAQLPRVSSERPVLIFGAATLSTIYNTTEHLGSSIPLRTVRLALRYGINSFDTSPYYGNSEIVLGAILKSLSQEYPRSTYTLTSKCGRYGPTKNDFDYSPATIRKSLTRTLRRLGTDHLDLLYLHDVEFVATRIAPPEIAGDANAGLKARDMWGLQAGEEALIRGDGDQVILDAYAELMKLREEGLVKAIGITGHTLPVLLRLALLIKSHFNEPVDALLSYSHYTLQNAALLDYLPHFAAQAGIKQIQCASPLNMGYLTPAQPKWHPAPPEMVQARDRAIDIIQSEGWPGGIADLALGFGLRRNRREGHEGDAGRGLPFDVPTVLGLSSLEQVHQAVEVWEDVNGLSPTSGTEAGISTSSPSARERLEDRVVKCFVESGWHNWSWDSTSGA